MDIIVGALANKAHFEFGLFKPVNFRVQINTFLAQLQGGSKGYKRVKTIVGK